MTSIVPWTIEEDIELIMRFLEYGFQEKDGKHKRNAATKKKIFETIGQVMPLRTHSALEVRWYSSIEVDILRGRMKRFGLSHVSVPIDPFQDITFALEVKAEEVKEIDQKRLEKGKSRELELILDFPNLFFHIFLIY